MGPQSAAARARGVPALPRRRRTRAAHPDCRHSGRGEQLASDAGERDDDEARSQYRRASLLLSDARRAGRLVADMLDLSRIDAGLALDLRATDLAALVGAEADRAALLAPQVTVTRTGVTELSIRADPTRLAQILSNLLDNARRYTPAGGSISVDLSSDGEVAEVTVTDTGQGVPDDERERIFERLVRLGCRPRP